ncbi:MAG: hypothetical protein EAZ57_04265 [Cytophagales bacterium]|nr:MAG: hypothetical protein EAZ67_05285 [Cytophagales bacterium]TAF61212.1 MAG: hypothetical protein EAZ57_04265 [Cytophagales bacterium]
MIWDKIAAFILRYKIVLSILLIAATLFFGYRGLDVRLSYDYSRAIPDDSPPMLFYKDFMRKFGDDANILAIGIEDKKIFQLQHFNALYDLAQEMSKIEGVQQVLSVPTVSYLHKNQDEKTFELKPLFAEKPRTQNELDSLMTFFKNLKFFEGQLFNEKTQATILALSLDRKIFNSNAREALFEKIMASCDKFSESSKVEMHYAGLPYVRTIMTSKVRREMNVFLVISFAITVVVVWLFFRSIYPVLVTFTLILITTIWSVGTLVLLGYKITLLTGLMPPILVVIAIPNSIYLLNKYQQEYLNTHDKLHSLKTVISKIGFVSVIANLTTAIGFFVFIFGNVTILKEFGIVVGINVCTTFLISIIFVPIALSYLPVPDTKQVKHLDTGLVVKLINRLEGVIQTKRTAVYLGSILISMVGLVGIYQLRVQAYMVDDLPEASGIIQDLRFMERHFKAVMPLELTVNTGKKKGFRDLARLKRIDSLEQKLAALPELSRPISIIAFAKAANQALGNNLSTEAYQIPTKSELGTIYSYLKKQKNNGNKDLTRTFIDSTGQELRLSAKVADIGTAAMRELIDNKVSPIIKEFNQHADSMKVTLTGTSYLFLLSNDYLIDSLKSSTWMALIFIALAHGLLFTNLRIIIISIVPNIVPMLLTAGLMGFFNVALKPSTAIIFSIVLGITVDNTVHFLARYKLALEETEGEVLPAVLVSMHETAHSMIYTSIVLFAGFIIFIWSDFGGTRALGALTSLTLFVALVTNLTLLPVLLITFDKTEKPQSSDSEDTNKKALV